MAGATLAAPYSFAGGSYPGTGGTCAATLAATATCSVVVEYAPVAAGTHTETLTINYFDRVASQSATRPMTGTGVNPALLVIDQGPTYNFGTVAVGGSSDVTLNVTNNGAFLASVMSGSGLTVPFTFKGGVYPGTGGTCASNLNAGASCTIVLNYAPIATECRRPPPRFYTTTE